MDVFVRAPKPPSSLPPLPPSLSSPSSLSPLHPPKSLLPPSHSLSLSVVRARELTLWWVGARLWGAAAAASVGAGDDEVPRGRLRAVPEDDHAAEHARQHQAAPALQRRRGLPCLRRTLRLLP
eukprot:3932418-Rhodomonas_salina.2